MHELLFLLECRGSTHYKSFYVGWTLFIWLDLADDRVSDDLFLLMRTHKILLELSKDNCKFD